MRPASRGPVGEATAATATSNSGSEYGAQVQPRVDQVVRAGLRVTVSPRSRRMMMSRFSSSSSRVSVGFRPIIVESVGSEPGPTAEHHPAAGEVVEQHHPLGHPQRVVVADEVTPVPSLM